MMGGRGTFASGKNVPYRWVTVDTIGTAKELRLTGNAKQKLPEESHSPNATYVRYTEGTGVFNMLRVYNENKQPILEIALGMHKGKVHLHWHILGGSVDKRGKTRGKDWDWLYPGDSYYEKYKTLIERRSKNV